MEKIIIKKRPFCKEDLLTIILIIPMLYYAGLYFAMKDISAIFFGVAVCSILLLILYFYIYRRIKDRESTITISPGGIVFYDKTMGVNETHCWVDVNHIEISANRGGQFTAWYLEIHLKSNDIPHKYAIDDFVSDPILLKCLIENYFESVKITRGNAPFFLNWGKYERANRHIYN